MVYLQATLYQPVEVDFMHIKLETYTKMHNAPTR